MNTLQIIELIAVASGIVHVFLLTREKISAWPFGLLTVSLYVYIFAVSRLYSDVILHIVYIALNLYGWWNWAQRKCAAARPIPITRMSRQELGGWAAAIALGAVAWGRFMASNTAADLPYADAFTTVASLCAQFLLARKKLENWVIWMVVDVAAMGIYSFKGLYLTTLLYAVYFLLSAKGWIDWRKTMAIQLKAAE